MSGLSTLAAATYGVLGALASLVITYVIPLGFGLARGRAQFHSVSWQKVLGIVIVLGATLFLGGLTAGALAKGGEAKDALAYGLAYQSSLVGIVGSVSS